MAESLHCRRAPAAPGGAGKAELRRKEGARTGGEGGGGFRQKGSRSSSRVPVVRILYLERAIKPVQQVICSRCDSAVLRISPDRTAGHSVTLPTKRHQLYATVVVSRRKSFWSWCVRQR